jgi:hypothetical protein
LFSRWFIKLHSSLYKKTSEVNTMINLVDEVLKVDRREVRKDRDGSCIDKAKGLLDIVPGLVRQGGETTQTNEVRYALRVAIGISREDPSVVGMATSVARIYNQSAGHGEQIHNIYVCGVNHEGDYNPSDCKTIPINGGK